jgi:amino acid transporter
VVLTGLAILLGGHSGLPQHAFSDWPAASAVSGSISLTFFAFTGFAVISNSAASMANPARELPRAMYITIGTVIALYLLLSFAVIAAATPEQMASASPTLLADLARILLGPAAYTAILLTAVAATVTCLYGGFYGITSISFSLAEKGALPERFSSKVGATYRGLTISALVVLVMVNFLSLSAIASLGSATSIMVYTLVNFGAFKLIRTGKIQRAVILASVIACSGALVIWVAYTLNSNPASLGIFAFFLAISFAVEAVLQGLGKRQKSQLGHAGTSATKA